MPKGEFDLVKYFNAGAKTKLPLLASSIHSMKMPSIRVWDKMGADIGKLQVWDKDGRVRPFKMFGSAGWARDPNSGKLLMISTGRRGEVYAWSNDIVPTLLHNVRILSFVDNLFKTINLINNFILFPKLGSHPQCYFCNRPMWGHRMVAGIRTSHCWL